MKKIRKLLKYKSLLFLFLLLLTGIFISTVAYFRKSLEVKNEIVNDTIRVKLIRNKYDSSNNITFYNNGSSTKPILLRFRYSESWKNNGRKICGDKNTNWMNAYYETVSNDSSGYQDYSISVSNPLYSFVASSVYEARDVLSNQVNGQDVVTKIWSSTFEDDFELYDGWYYYKKVFKPKEKINVLDNYVVNNDLLAGTYFYEDYNFYYNYEILIDYEAVHPVIADVQNAWGASFTLDGDNVVWSFSS